MPHKLSKNDYILNIEEQRKLTTSSEQQRQQQEWGGFEGSRQRTRRRQRGCRQGWYPGELLQRLADGEGERWARPGDLRQQYKGGDVR